MYERRKQVGLHPNMKQCPFCWFVIEYEEEYDVHRRAHAG